MKKKVPPTRALDELIRSIEEVEQVSESIVESIDFNNYDGLVAESVLAPTETEVTRKRQKQQKQQKQQKILQLRKQLLTQKLPFLQ